MEGNLRPLRWVRCNNGMLAGVASGIAKALDIAPWLVRVAFIAAIPAAGAGLFFYLMCAIALPREDRQELGRQKMILGVCSRLDARGDLEVGLARLIAQVLLLASFGAAVVGYVILHFILTPAPLPPEKQSPRL